MATATVPFPAPPSVLYTTTATYPPPIFPGGHYDLYLPHSHGAPPAFPYAATHPYQHPDAAYAPPPCFFPAPPFGYPPATGFFPAPEYGHATFPPVATPYPPVSDTIFSGAATHSTAITPVPTREHFQLESRHHMPDPLPPQSTSSDPSVPFPGADLSSAEYSFHRPASRMLPDHASVTLGDHAPLLNLQDSKADAVQRHATDSASTPTAVPALGLVSMANNILDHAFVRLQATSTPTASGSTTTRAFTSLVFSAPSVSPSAATAYVAPQVFGEMPPQNSWHEKPIENSCQQSVSTSPNWQNLDEVPQAYGLHNLNYRSVIRADGTEHSYYALPEKYPLEQAPSEPVFDVSANEKDGYSTEFVDVLARMHEQSNAFVDVLASTPDLQLYEEEQQKSAELPKCFSQLTISSEKPTIGNVDIFSLTNEQSPATQCRTYDEEHQGDQNILCEKSVCQSAAGHSISFFPWDPGASTPLHSSKFGTSVQQLRDPSWNALIVPELRTEWDLGEHDIRSSIRHKDISAATYPPMRASPDSDSDGCSNDLFRRCTGTHEEQTYKEEQCESRQAPECSRKPTVGVEGVLSFTNEKKSDAEILAMCYNNASDNAFTEEATYLTSPNADVKHAGRSLKLANGKNTQAADIGCVQGAIVHYADETSEINIRKHDVLTNKHDISDSKSGVSLLKSNISPSQHPCDLNNVKERSVRSTTRCSTSFLKFCVRAAYPILHCIWDPVIDVSSHKKLHTFPWITHASLIILHQQNFIFLEIGRQVHWDPGIQVMNDRATSNSIGTIRDAKWLKTTAACFAEQEHMANTCSKMVVFTWHNSLSAWPNQSTVAGASYTWDPDPSRILTGPSPYFSFVPCLLDRERVLAAVRCPGCSVPSPRRPPQLAAPPGGGGGSAMQEAQRGKGAARPRAGTRAEDWLSLSTYESLHQVGSQQEQVLVAGGIVIGYVIDNPASNIPAEGELLPGTMFWKRSADSAEVTPVSCSFLVVDTSRRATDMFKASMAINHKRLAKVFFTAKSNRIDGHVVCYEKLTPYHIDSHKPMRKDKRTWQFTIRQVFETLDALLKQNYGIIVFGSSKDDNYLYYGKGEDSYGFPRVQKEDTEVDIVKLISACSIPPNKINDETKKQQLTNFLDLIGEFGVRELDEEYASFQSLVKQRKYYNMPILLGHPFVLPSNKERVDIVPTLNEDVHGLIWENYETYMGEKLPELAKTWKKRVREKGFVRMLDRLGSYADTFQGLLRFLRNFVTHERDAALCRDVNIAHLHASVYQPFGAFLCWTYTYIHTIE